MQAINNVHSHILNSAYALHVSYRRHSLVKQPLSYTLLPSVQSTLINCLHLHSSFKHVLHMYCLVTSHIVHVRPVFIIRQNCYSFLTPSPTFSYFSSLLSCHSHLPHLLSFSFPLRGSNLSSESSQLTTIVTVHL